MKNEIAQPSDDNLVCPEVGSWTEDKHRVVSLYTTMFSKGMKPSGTIVHMSSSMLALGIAGSGARKNSY
jgi:hypothetical protein